MRTLHVIMPMAGRGSRFANAGYTIPKPLIEVDGQPMFKKALSSLDTLDTPKRLTVIIRQEHVEQYKLDEQLKAIDPEINVVVTNEEPTGAAVDAYRAKPFLKPEEGVLIADCDIWFGGAEYFELLQKVLSDEIEVNGTLLTFHSTEPRFSFALTDTDGFVQRTAEKEVISNQAIGGAYFFATSQDFIEACDGLFKKPLGEGRPEYYISYLYNVLLEQGKKVMARGGEFTSFGTPDELDAYNASQATEAA